MLSRTLLKQIPEMLSQPVLDNFVVFETHLHRRD
jgi:hypothetical protein